MRLTPYIKPESTGLHLTGSVSVDHWQCMARAAGFCLRTFTHARTPSNESVNGSHPWSPKSGRAKVCL